MSRGRPSFQVLDGLRADRDEADMEAAALREDMKAAARRLRLVCLTSIWSQETPRHVLRIAERLEAQAKSSRGAA